MGFGWVYKKVLIYGVVGFINLFSIRVYGYGYNIGFIGMSVCYVVNLVFEIIYLFD